MPAQETRRQGGEEIRKGEREEKERKGKEKKKEKKKEERKKKAKRKYLKSNEANLSSGIARKESSNNGRKKGGRSIALFGGRSGKGREQVKLNILMKTIKRKEKLKKII